MNRLCRFYDRGFPNEGRDGDEQAAYAVAAWLQRANFNGSLASYFNPPLTLEEREIADIPLPECGYKIKPSEIRFVDGEHVKCPSCGKVVLNVKHLD